MQTVSLILIVVLGFFALWLVTRNEEHMSSGSVGLNGATRLAGGGPWGPSPWAPALINERNRASGSPCRVPFDWVPTPGSEQPPCVVSEGKSPRRREERMPEKMTT
jgi:hypothetical protein